MFEFLEVRFVDTSVSLPGSDCSHHSFTLESEVVENDLVEFSAVGFCFLDLINHS